MRWSFKRAASQEAGIHVITIKNDPFSRQIVTLTLNKYLRIIVINIISHTLAPPLGTGMAQLITISFVMSRTNIAPYNVGD